MKTHQIYTPSGELFTKLILETFRFNGLLIASGDQLAKEIDLSSALWQVLGAVGEAPLSMAQIARNMGLSRQSVRRSANKLKDKGLINFENNPDHKRAKLVVMTKKGLQILEKMKKKQVDWSNHLSEEFSSKDLEETVKMIKSLSDQLGKNIII